MSIKTLSHPSPIPTPSTTFTHTWSMSIKTLSHPSPHHLQQSLTFEACQSKHYHTHPHTIYNNRSHLKPVNQKIITPIPTPSTTFTHTWSMPIRRKRPKGCMQSWNMFRTKNQNIISSISHDLQPSLTHEAHLPVIYRLVCNIWKRMIFFKRSSTNYSWE